jgi:hypothetical protein
MVAENEGELARIKIVIFVVPEVHEAAEQAARRHGQTLTDALKWWTHLLALSQWLPNGQEAALMRLWFECTFPQRKDPPCP